jgi:predicted SprT family Zn-dependent metalloprotease
MRNENPKPTPESYNALEFAFDSFNEKLFGGELKPCLITMQRRRKAYGFFASARFRSHDESNIVDEIGLDPKHWERRSIEENLSVLVHEMVHLWQHHDGKPSRGYHNREFSRKMFQVGLITSDTGEKGGKPTGQRMSHYIQPGGPFERACAELVNSGFVIPYHEIVPQDDDDARKSKRRERAKAASKTSYVCPNCRDVRAWGKPGLLLACRRCGGDLDESGFSRSEEAEWSPWREVGDLSLSKTITET